MLHKRWGKSNYARVANRLLLSACALILLLCSGCAMFLRPAATPAPVLAEEPETQPQETPVPEEENPLNVFLNGFYQAYAPLEDALNALSEEDTSAIDEALLLEKHMLRLKQLFDAQARLLQNPTDHNTWDGILFGGVEGTGSVTKTADGCTFSCVLNGAGNITGSLKGGVLVAEWMQLEGAIRSGTIIKTDTGYAASLDWGGEDILLLIEGDTLYFGAGVAIATGSSLLPYEEWADWRLTDGRLSAPVPMATSSSIQEDL